MLNSYSKGGQNFDSEFRVLVVGAGTGSSALYLAEQLNNTGAQVDRGVRRSFEGGGKDR